MFADSLLIDLRAEDYNATSGAWDNRASSGPVDIANGDFVATTTNVRNIPRLETLGGATAVVFDPTDGTDRLESANTYFPSTIWGGDDWSLEYWVFLHSYTPANVSAQFENPVFQWAPRVTPANQAAYIGIGYGSYGAGECGAGTAHTGVAV